MLEKSTKELISNKKTGFAFPLQKHLYNDLKFELINEFQKLKNDERLGRLKTDKLNNIINRFLNNNDYKLVYQVWSIYVFSSGLTNIRNILITSFIIQLILSIFFFSKFSKGY